MRQALRESAEENAQRRKENIKSWMQQVIRPILDYHLGREAGDPEHQGTREPVFVTPEESEDESHVARPWEEEQAETFPPRPPSTSAASSSGAQPPPPNQQLAEPPSRSASRAQRRRKKNRK